MWLFRDYLNLCRKRWLIEWLHRRWFMLCCNHNWVQTNERNTTRDKTLFICVYCGASRFSSAVKHREFEDDT